MKRLGDTSFFLLFDRLMANVNPGLKLDHFVVDGVTWARERHNFAGNTYGFSLEVFTGSCLGTPGWTMTAVKEYWWKSDHRSLAKSAQWIILNSGNKSDAAAWFRRQQARLA